MRNWLKVAAWIDELNERVGRFASWLVVAIVLLGAWNAIARYISRYTEFNWSSNAYLELQWYMFSVIFLLGGAYTHKRDEHVRVDVWHSGLHPLRQARIDIVGTIIFLIPFCLFILWTSWFPVRNSWVIREMSPDPGGLPRYPVKTLIPLAFILLLAQAVSQLVKRWHFMKEHGDQHPSTSNGPDTSSSIQSPISKFQLDDAGGDP